MDANEKCIQGANQESIKRKEKHGRSSLKYKYIEKEYVTLFLRIATLRAQ
jgi:hypothetical protein